MAASARTWKRQIKNPSTAIKAARCEQKDGKINAKGMVTDSQVLLYHAFIACGMWIRTCHLYQAWRDLL